MSYLFGMTIAILGIFFSITHLKQSFVMYFDVVAAMVVFGGTFAIAMMIFPWKYFRDFMYGIRTILLPSFISGPQIAASGLKLLQGQVAFSQNDRHLAYQTLQDGNELIGLGFSLEKIEFILTKRILQQESRLQSVGNSLKAMAKYPPAFGLVGTVLGLVSLMRAISSSAGGEEIGLRMAVALVATLYGLLISNLVINPIGEKFIKLASEDTKLALIALESIILKCNQVSILEAQEVLNSFLPAYSRINLLKLSSEPFNGVGES